MVQHMFKMCGEIGCVGDYISRHLKPSSTIRIKYNCNVVGYITIEQLYKYY